MKNFTKTSVIAVLLSLFLAGHVYTQTATPPTEGDGSIGTPYQIATWQNLLWLSENVDKWDKHFIQTANIDFNDATPKINTWDGNKGWTPIGTYDDPFNGTYDGMGHIIKDLFIDRDETEFVALFGFLGEDAIIKHIGVVNANIKGEAHVGALAGGSFGLIKNTWSSGVIEGLESVGGLAGTNVGTIRRSWSESDVKGGEILGGLIGGLIGYLKLPDLTIIEGDGLVEDSYATGNIEYLASYGGGDTLIEYGGFIGYNHGGEIKNAFALGNVKGNDLAGGFIGGNYGTSERYGIIEKAFAIGTVEIESDKTHIGGFAGHNYEPNNNQITYSFWDRESSGQTSTAGNAIGETTANMKNQSTFNNVGWNFTDVWGIHTDINDGYPYLIWQLGEYAIEPPYVNNAYEISTVAHLYWLSQNENVWDADFIQTADIVFPEGILLWDNGAGWTPIGNGTTPFRGTYDGQNHVIEDLFINRPTADFQGLFGAMVGTNANNKAILRNIRIDGVDITALGRVGSLLGKVDDNHHTLIENCQAVNGTVRGQFTAGGLVGANNGTQTGPPASNQTLLQYCFADIEVIFTGDGNEVDIKIGGLVGCGQRGTIRNSFALGDVNGINGSYKADRVGGLAGCIIQGSVTNAYALGEVTADNDNVGALVGQGRGLGAADGITNSFYYENNEATNFNTLGTSKTTTELQDQATYTGWDFDNIWAIGPNATVNKGFPYLLSNPPSGNAQPIVENEFTGTDGEWDESSNWSEGIPTSSSIVIIPAGKDVVIGTTTNYAEVLDLIIRPNASLTIESGGELKVAGNMFINANEDGTGSFIDDGTLEVEGQVFVQKFLPIGVYGQTVSSPIEDADENVFAGADDTYFFNPLKDETTSPPVADWDNDITDNITGNLVTMRGYWTRFNDGNSTKTLEFVGIDTYLHTGQIVFNQLYRTAYAAGNMGWNFLGNPYPSYISWDEVIDLDENTSSTDFTTTTNLNNAVYIANNSGGYWAYVNGAGITGFENGIIPPATAFWVQVFGKSGENTNIYPNGPVPDAKLTFDNSVRVHNSNGNNNRLAAPEALRLYLDNQSHSDELVFGFRNGATTAFNPSTDAVKLFASNPAIPQIYALADAGQKMVIKALPDAPNTKVSIPLGFKNNAGASLQISVNDLSLLRSGLQVYLEDLHTNVMHSFNETDTYAFKSSATQDDERFILHLNYNAVTGTAQATLEAATHIYTYGEALYIAQSFEQSTVKVYNLMGQEVYSTALSHSGLHKLSPGLATGHYVVQLLSAEKSVTQKVFIE